MDVLTQIQAEIERELLASESAIVLRRIRQRIGELTFGDLMVLLATPAGRRLHARGFAELLPAEPEARPPARRRVKQADVSGALLAALHAAGRPLSLRELVEAVGHGLRQVQRAMQQLRARGQVLMVDPPPRPTYWAQQGGEYRMTTASRNAADVVAALRAGGALSLREVCAATGLTEERARRAIAHLLDSGQVQRLGRSVSTRYVDATTAAEVSDSAVRTGPRPGAGDAA